MSSDWAIRVSELSKCYPLFERPSDRLRQMLWRGQRKYYQEFWALRDVTLEVGRGEVLGIIGRNGAGKSTLLQLLCGTLTPTAGKVQILGRMAALLELGAGFNQEFSGRENIYLLAALSGFSRAETEAKIEEIIDFSGIRDFIDQPVKTYSSGMFIRLAFSIATSVDPDILVIDEALSVGDGEFARRSFERIMRFKAEGKTILFCSHALYQVEALCSRAIWLEQGRVAALGSATVVTAAYREATEASQATGRRHTQTGGDVPARLTGLTFYVNGEAASTGQVRIHSRQDSLAVHIAFISDPTLPPPSVAISFATMDGQMVCGVGSINDGQVLPVDTITGRGVVETVFPQLPLLKGRYLVNIVLACERALHVYESVESAAVIEVMQDDLEQGLVHLPHEWLLGGGTEA